MIKIIHDALVSLSTTDQVTQNVVLIVGLSFLIKSLKGCLECCFFLTKSLKVALNVGLCFLIKSLKVTLNVGLCFLIKSLKVALNVGLCFLIKSLKGWVECSVVFSDQVTKRLC